MAAELVQSCRMARGLELLPGLRGKVGATVRSVGGRGSVRRAPCLRRHGAGNLHALKSREPGIAHKAFKSGLKTSSDRAAYKARSEATDPHAQSLCEMLVKKAHDFVEGNDVDAIIQIDVVGARNDHQLLALSSRLKRVFAEIPRVSFLPRYEQNGSRCNLRNMREEGKIHERHRPRSRPRSVGIG